MPETLLAELPEDQATGAIAQIYDEIRRFSGVPYVSSLQRYLATDVPGLWFDRLKPDGRFVRQSAPASSFYHIVCAIAELSAALERA